MSEERDYDLIRREMPKKPDRLEVKRTRAYRVEIPLTVAQLFEALGIAKPAEETQVHIVLARSHGNEGSYYNLREGGGYVVEVRMKWEVEEER